MSNERARPRGGPWGAGAILLLAALAACGAPSDPSTVRLPSLPVWVSDDPQARPGPEQAELLIGRAVWGVVPDAGEGLPTQAMIRGSAVAVAPDTLLTSCAGVGSDGSVDLLRRSAHRRAVPVASDRARQVCALRPANVDLRPVRAYRAFDDLRVGEPILAVVSRTSRRFAVERGVLVGKGGREDPYLETTLSVPADTVSAALFDAYGNLIGFGSASSGTESLLVGVPVPEGLVPDLAHVRLNGSPALMAEQEPSAPRGRAPE